MNKWTADDKREIDAIALKLGQKMIDFTLATVESPADQRDEILTEIKASTKKLWSDLYPLLKTHMPLPISHWWPKFPSREKKIKFTASGEKFMAEFPRQYALNLVNYLSAYSDRMAPLWMPDYESQMQWASYHNARLGVLLARKLKIKLDPTTYETLEWKFTKETK